MDLTVMLLELVREFVSFLSVIAWPLIAAGLLLYLFKSKNAHKQIARLLKPFRSIRWRGVEIVLTEEAAKELSQNCEEAFGEYRKQAKREYDRLSAVYNLRERLENVVQVEVKEVLGRIDDIPSLRCTIHIPDILFAESLYQLLDYYPNGTGRGRTRSVRFGIIGKAWRLEKPQTEGDVPTDAEGLILGWGMTREEALAAGQGRNSFSCVVLKDDNHVRVGIFYMDSTKSNAFGSNKEAKQRIWGHRGFGVSRGFGVRS